MNTHHAMTRADYPTESAYRNAHADRLREQLYAMLGGCCAECGALAPLEIDHPWGRDWGRHRVILFFCHDHIDRPV